MVIVIPLGFQHVRRYETPNHANLLIINVLAILRFQAEVSEYRKISHYFSLGWQTVGKNFVSLRVQILSGDEHHNPQNNDLKTWQKYRFF